MIEVTNSAIIVHDYELGDNPTIEKYLSIKEKVQSGYYLTTFTAYLYDEERRQLIIPRGYDIGRLKLILRDERVFYNKKHDVSRRTNLELTVGPRDELQKKSIEFLTEQGQYSNLLYNSQKFLCLKTGKGKTYCMINAICHYKRRSIIIVDSITIIEQWKKSFLEFTNIEEKDIYIISGIKSITNIMNEKKFEPDYKIYIAMHQTLSSLTKRNVRTLTDFFNKIKVGIKVYDEAHTCWRTMFTIDGYTNTERTFYLTATPGRSDPYENRLYNFVFEKVPIFGREEFDTKSYSYSTEQVSESEKYHKIYYINFDSKPSYENQLRMIKRDGKFDMHGYSDYCRTEGYDILLYILFKLINICLKQKSERKIAIILSKNDIIQKLYEDISSAYPEMEVGRFCGLVSKEQKEVEKEKRIILSTEKSLGKAVDIKNIGFLINLVPFSSKVIAEQLIGRLRKNDKFSFLFDLADLGFKNCKNNQKYRSETYDKIAFSIRKIEFNPSEEEMKEFLNGYNN